MDWTPLQTFHKHVTPQQLQKFFPDVSIEELVRPKEIHLLISHREGQLAPQKIRTVGDLILWDGPLGTTVGGCHCELFEELAMSANMSKTHFARSMRAAALKYEEQSLRNFHQPNRLLSKYRSHKHQPPIGTSWTGGSGIALEQHVSQSAGVPAVVTASQAGKK